MSLTRRNLLAGAAAAAIALPAVATTAGASAANAAGWSALAPGAEPDSNPLKGFIPFQGAYTAFPYSMEWSYFAVNAVMTGPHRFDWDVLEQSLEQNRARGHQTALRFYLDYPGRPSGIPQYLIDGGLLTRSYNDYGNNGISVSPDYDDPNLRAAMAAFIAGFGRHYDGDPRIGFIQLGLLGFWGEWHTYPYNGSGGEANWFASDTTQRGVLDEYLNAFHRTKLEVRYPNAMNAALPIGYHDDSFALETMTSSLGWHFMDDMVAAGTTEKWKTQSIGGELRPELQSCIFSTGSGACPVIEAGGDNNFAGSVAQTHATWLINHYAFATGYSPEDKPAALAGAKSLGYSFRATSALVPSNAPAGPAQIGLSVSNIGIAPFYYDWPITLGCVDHLGRLVRQFATRWNVSDVASGSTQNFVTTIELSGLRPGSYTVVAQVPNPMRGGQPLRFANASQDTTLDGWLTLGTTQVNAPLQGTGPRS